VTERTSGPYKPVPLIPSSSCVDQVREENWRGTG